MSRIRLFDYMHLAHNARAVDVQMRAKVLEDGIPIEIDTKILKLTTRSIFNQSDKGGYITGVFLEGRNTKRKQYFKELNNRRGNGTDYKGSRGHSSIFYEDVNRAVSIMHSGGISCYKYEKINEFGEPFDGLEADDLIVSMVRKLKEMGVTQPIDIVTNDSDLLPLVDEQVSVYLRGTRTYAEGGCPEYNKYYQVTPRSWEEALQYRSDFKDFYIPYNSMLLFKLIRGDKADEYGGIGKMTFDEKSLGKVAYSKLMEQMVIDGVDFQNIFKYGVDFNEVIRPVLVNYFPKETVDFMYDTYLGIDMAYVNLEPPTKIDIGKLQTVLTPFQINLFS